MLSLCPFSRFHRAPPRPAAWSFERRGLPYAVVLATLATLAACAPGEGEAPRLASGTPSVLLISVDTTRADRVGAYGYRAGSTPNIDRIAARGVVFERAWTPVPVTLPAHASLLTGLLPQNHGVRDNALYRLPDDVPTLAGILRDAGYATRGVVGAEILDRQYGLGRGFDTYDDRVGALSGLSIPERPAAEVTDAALRAADGLKPPFLLFVHYFDPHADYHPPPPFSTRFGQPYDGEIAYADQEIGRLVDGLERRGLMADTLVAIVSDHGESLGEHGEPTHGVFLYQSTVHVPLVVAAPGRVPAGLRVAEPCSLIDVLPTLLELASLDAPDGLDGRSLVPTLRGAAAPGDSRWLVLESEFGFNSYGWAPLAGVTNGRWKWIGAPRPELYDLIADPAELHDLAAERPAEVSRLRGLWNERRGRDLRAPPPGEATDPEQAARLERLSALGYVSAPGRRRADPASLPDPKDVIGTLERINQARAALARGSAREAAAVLEQVLRLAPDNLSALALLGSSRIMTSDFTGAAEVLRRAAALAPHQADVHFDFGIALAGSGDLAGAEAAWRRTLAVSPRFLEALANLVDLLLGSGRVDDAARALEEAETAGLAGPVVDYLAGRVALARGDRARAAEALRRALAGSLPARLADDARRQLAGLDGARSGEGGKP